MGNGEWERRGGGAGFRPPCPIPMPAVGPPPAANRLGTLRAGAGRARGTDPIIPPHPSHPVPSVGEAGGARRTRPEPGPGDSAGSNSAGADSLDFLDPSENERGLPPLIPAVGRRTAAQREAVRTQCLTALPSPVSRLPSPVPVPGQTGGRQEVQLSDGRSDERHCRRPGEAEPPITCS